MVGTTLLKNGVVIVHGADDVARGVRADLLIEDGKIAQIEASLNATTGAEVIDCTDKIIAPGFIDTHRHMYNIALRGTHGNDLLADYLVKGQHCINNHREVTQKFRNKGSFANTGMPNSRYLTRWHVRSAGDFLGPAGGMS